MAFLPYSYDHGQPQPFEYYPLGEAGSLAVGQCLELGDGVLAASGEPTHISMREDASAAEGELIPVIRITEEMVFEVPMGDGMTVSPGDTAGIGGDGLTLTMNGDAVMIMSMDGDEPGDLCRCRFIGK